MRVTVLPASRLTDDHVSRWSEIQQAEPSLASPFFRPEFAQALASVRDDVAVGIVEEGRQVAGFFPFQRTWGRSGRPMGEPLSDFHGLVARQGCADNAAELIRACGLSAWRFDHLPADQQPFRAYRQVETPSPFMDLCGGFEAYQEKRRLAGSGDIARIQASVRAAERQVGPLRFEFHTTEDRVFEALVRWKSEQYRSTGCTNVFAFPWAVQLLERIRRRQSPLFSGLLSALYFGDRLAAVHLGMRCAGVLHYWFPAYDPALGRHSPGRICLLEIAKAAAAQGVRRIDLGKGMEPYKSRLMSGAISVAEGIVECGAVRRALSRRWRNTRRLAQASLLGGPVRLAAVLTRPLRRWIMFR